MTVLMFLALLASDPAKACEQASSGSISWLTLLADDPADPDEATILAPGDEGRPTRVGRMTCRTEGPTPTRVAEAE